MSTESFLKPNISQIRKTIRGIDDSYNNEWDIVAELLQNAVDAIRLQQTQSTEKAYKGKIAIEINAVERSIIVEDNGIGIEAKRLAPLLAPFSSDKDNDDDTIGEKGVGLTFVLFQCNEFRVETRAANSSCTGVVKDAFNWKNSRNTTQELKVDIQLKGKKTLGTRIFLNDVQQCDLFNLNFSQLEYVLRTRTAIGNIDENQANIDVQLKHTDINNQTEKKRIKFSYFLPMEALGANEKIDYDEFNQKYTGAEHTDSVKRKALFGKIIYRHKEFSENNRRIRYQAYFVPNREAWDILNKKFSLIDPDASDEQTKIAYALLSHGIFTAVKGMPTGISITPPRSGNAGYWNNIFIIFEYNRLSFDIGRKSIPGAQTRMLQRFALEIFNEFASVIKYVTRANIISENDWGKEETFAKIKEMPSMHYHATKFTKLPVHQEAQVCAMFYEQAALGNITGFEFLTSGYKSRYDLYAKWNNKSVVIEFKAQARNILRDFNDEQKMFDEIDCLVCWEITDEDRKAFHQRSIALTEIEARSSFVSNEVISFPNATHKLELNMSNPIYIIDLKCILEKTNY